MSSLLNKIIKFYSLSHFRNVYCFATNQMRDETAKDDRQTAGGISHDLTRNNELALSSTRNKTVNRFLIYSYFITSGIFLIILIL